MTKVKLLLLTALLSLSVIIIGLFLQGGRALYNPRRIIDSMPHNVDMQLSGINFTEINQGQREWTLKADTMRYMKAENLMVFNQVKATFFAPDGPMHITGDQGYYNQEKQNVLLTGEVSANDTQGNHLQTRELQYDLENQVVNAPGSFKLSGPDMDLVGHGLSVDTKTNRLKVSGRPTLVFKSAKSIL